MQAKGELDLGSCLDEDQILAFARNEGSTNELQRLERHLDDCPGCFDVVAHAVRVNLPGLSCVRGTSAGAVKPSVNREMLKSALAHDPFQSRRSMNAEAFHYPVRMATVYALGNSRRKSAPATAVCATASS